MRIKIVVGSDSDVKDFVYNYVPKSILKSFIAHANKQKLKLFDEEFGVNSYDALLYALKHLNVVKHKNFTYVIEFNKNLKYNNLSIMYYVNLVTYGNRSIRGYDILPKIFRFNSNNIHALYMRWMLGIKI